MYLVVVGHRPARCAIGIKRWYSNICTEDSKWLNNLSPLLSLFPSEFTQDQLTKTMALSILLLISVCLELIDLCGFYNLIWRHKEDDCSLVRLLPISTSSTRNIDIIVFGKIYVQNNVHVLIPLRSSKIQTAIISFFIRTVCYLIDKRMFNQNIILNKSSLMYMIIDIIKRNVHDFFGQTERNCRSRFLDIRHWIVRLAAYWRGMTSLTLHYMFIRSALPYREYVCKSL